MILNGDSSYILGDLLKEIKSTVTFWLDAHNGYKTALINELRAIAKHPVKNHIIMIDDLRCWKTELCGFDIDIIKRCCKNINKDYKFIFENGESDKRIFINDILIAKL